MAGATSLNGPPRDDKPLRGKRFPPAGEGRGCLTCWVARPAQPYQQSERLNSSCRRRRRMAVKCIKDLFEKKKKKRTAFPRQLFEGLLYDAP